MELIAILENPIYIINIGSVIRNINGLGVDKLYIIDPAKRLESDPDELRKRKTLLQHSNGAVKWTDIRRFDSPEECLEVLKEKGFISVGTTPEIAGKRNEFLHDCNLKQPKLAIWFGNESNGLSQTVIDACDFCLTIEMQGKTESLNLATTTGIVLFEAIRQRKK